MFTIYQNNSIEAVEEELEGYRQQMRELSVPVSYTITVGPR